MADAYHQENRDPVGEWAARAKCKGLDPEVMFPEYGKGVEKAKRVCDDCPVIVECGNHAIDQRELYGVWGGWSEKERRGIRRRMQRAQLRAALEREQRRSTVAG